MTVKMTRRRFKPRTPSKSVRREAEPNQTLAHKPRPKRRTRSQSQQQRKLQSHQTIQVMIHLRKILKRNQLLKLHPQRKFQPRNKNQVMTQTHPPMMSQRRRFQLKLLQLRKLQQRKTLAMMIVTVTAIAKFKYSRNQQAKPQQRKLLRIHQAKIVMMRVRKKSQRENNQTSQMERKTQRKKKAMMKKLKRRTLVSKKLEVRMMTRKNSS